MRITKTLYGINLLLINGLSFGVSKLFSTFVDLEPLMTSTLIDLVVRMLYRLISTMVIAVQDVCPSFASVIKDHVSDSGHWLMFLVHSLDSHWWYKNMVTISCLKAAFVLLKWSSVDFVNARFPMRSARQEERQTWISWIAVRSFWFHSLDRLVNSPSLGFKMLLVLRSQSRSDCFSFSSKGACRSAAWAPPAKFSFISSILSLTWDPLSFLLYATLTAFADHLPRISWWAQCARCTPKGSTAFSHF